MKFGLEKEFFVLKDNKPILVPKYLPYDESGLLAEARGEPFNDIVDAVYSLMAARYKIQTTVAIHGLSITDIPIMKIDRKLKLEAMRNFPKGLVKYQNLYGYEFHKNAMNEHTAGVHLSVTNPQSVYGKDKEYYYYNGIWDYVRFFRYLDKKFAFEITNSKRRPGFYEIKPDGRIEYRSLPSDVDFTKIIEAVQEYNW